MSFSGTLGGSCPAVRCFVISTIGALQQLEGITVWPPDHSQWHQESRRSAVLREGGRARLRGSTTVEGCQAHATQACRSVWQHRCIASSFGTYRPPTPLSVGSPARASAKHTSASVFAAASTSRRVRINLAGESVLCHVTGHHETRCMHETYGNRISSHTHY